jgi:hypothetical protein
VGIDTEYDDEPVTLISNKQGERSAASIKVTVSHDLGDRTLVVVVLLACVIGVCGWKIGHYTAATEMNGQYMRDVATKLQINTNHVTELERLVDKENGNADQR